ncbi:MAG: TIGR00341 family protein [Rickettsiales bacterium]
MQRIIHILADKKQSKNISKDSLAKELDIVDHWEMKGEDGLTWHTFLLDANDVQLFMDEVQPLLDDEKLRRVLVSELEVSLPLSEKEEETQKKKSKEAWLFSKISREELYNDVVEGASHNANYLLLVLFATIVGAIALLNDNIAIMIGAMVIAPLLGPIIALSFAVVIGDLALARMSIQSNIIGLGLCIITGFLIGMFTSLPEEGVLLGLTKIGYESILVALCSGAVGVITLTQPTRSSLVGVMVAVALLPPAVATGLFLGNYAWAHAAHTGLLLFVNIICIMLVGQGAFTLLRLKPHMKDWLEEKNAKKHYYRYLWLTSAALSLAVLAIVYIKEF